MGVAQGFVTEEPEVIIARRREHSRKPDEAYLALEWLYGDERRLELFGRRARPGWERWGNQLLAPDAQAMLPPHVSSWLVPCAFEDRLRPSGQPSPFSAHMRGEPPQALSGYADLRSE